MPGIAVVDDSRIDRQWATACLRKAGYRAEAILPLSLAHVSECLAGMQPDLILLDYHIPDCPGATVARTCKVMPRLRGIPVVLLTAHHDPASLAEIAGLDLACILRKPCPPQRLAEAVDLVLARIRSSQTVGHFPGPGLRLSCQGHA